MESLPGHQLRHCPCLLLDKAHYHQPLRDTNIIQSKHHIYNIAMHRFFPVFLILKKPHRIHFEGVRLAPAGIPRSSPRPPGRSSGKLPRGAPGLFLTPSAAPSHQAIGQAEGLKGKQLSGECLACFIRVIFSLVHLVKSRMSGYSPLLCPTASSQCCVWRAFI